jgi:hypothetical protein
VYLYAKKALQKLREEVIIEQILRGTPPLKRNETGEIFRKDLRNVLTEVAHANLDYCK